MPHQRAKSSRVTGPEAARNRRVTWATAWSGSWSVQPPSQVSGRVKRTCWPLLGAKQSRPRAAAGLSSAPQLSRSLSPSSTDPVSSPTLSASSSRVSSVPSRAWATASFRRSSSARGTKARCQAPASQFRRVERAACQRGNSAAGSRCRVPRMAQVLTRLRSSHRARPTSPGSRPSIRAARVSSAEDITWACSPAISATTSSMALAGTRSSRWWRAARQAMTWAQSSLAAVAATSGQQGPEGVLDLAGGDRALVAGADHAVAVDHQQPRLGGEAVLEEGAGRLGRVAARVDLDVDEAGLAAELVGGHHLLVDHRAAHLAAAQQRRGEVHHRGAAGGQGVVQRDGVQRAGRLAGADLLAATGVATGLALLPTAAGTLAATGTAPWPTARPPSRSRAAATIQLPASGNSTWAP